MTTMQTQGETSNPIKTSIKTSALLLLDGLPYPPRPLWSGFFYVRQPCGAGLPADWICGWDELFGDVGHPKRMCLATRRRLRRWSAYRCYLSLQTMFKISLWRFIAWPYTCSIKPP